KARDPTPRAGVEASELHGSSWPSRPRSNITASRTATAAGSDAGARAVAVTMALACAPRALLSAVREVVSAEPKPRARPVDPKALGAPVCFDSKRRERSFPCSTIELLLQVGADRIRTENPGLCQTFAPEDAASGHAPETSIEVRRAR